jgi:hypothetical protein
VIDAVGRQEGISVRAMLDFGQRTRDQPSFSPQVMVSVPALAFTLDWASMLWVTASSATGHASPLADKTYADPGTTAGSDVHRSDPK